MIYGVGTDICELVRVQQTYDRFGEHFVRRLLMDEEQALFNPENGRQDFWRCASRPRKPR